MSLNKLEVAVAQEYVNRTDSFQLRSVLLEPMYRLDIDSCCSCYFVTNSLVAWVELYVLGRVHSFNSTSNVSHTVQPIACGMSFPQTCNSNEYQVLYVTSGTFR